jgi:hypothetical protein
MATVQASFNKLFTQLKPRVGSIKSPRVKVN